MNDRRPSANPIFQRCDRTAAYPYTIGEYGRRLLWEWVQATLIRFSPRRAMGWRRLWLRLFGATVPRSSGVRPTTKVWHPWLLQMGEHSILGDGVEVYNLGQVTLGDHTVVSQGAYLCAGTHDYTRADLPLQRPPITIGSGVWICAQAFIGPGVTVGDNSVVGARAVVVRNVEAGLVVGGNPATVIKPRPMGENDTKAEPVDG